MYFVAVVILNNASAICFTLYLILHSTYFQYNKGTMEENQHYYHQMQIHPEIAAKRVCYFSI